jgi:hypothetical protein
LTNKLIAGEDALPVVGVLAQRHQQQIPQKPNCKARFWLKPPEYLSLHALKGVAMFVAMGLAIAGGN